MVIKRIGPASFAKISGIVYTIVGLLGGALISLASMVGGFGARSGAGAGLGAAFGVAAILVLPIV